MVLTGIVLSLLGCIYTQDQNRVTKADVDSIAATVQKTQADVNTMSRQFEYLQGQLQAKNVIDGNK